MVRSRRSVSRRSRPHLVLLAGASALLLAAAAPGAARASGIEDPVRAPTAEGGIRTGIPSEHLWHVQVDGGLSAALEVGDMWAAGARILRWAGDFGPGHLSWGPGLQVGRGQDSVGRTFPERTVQRELTMGALHLLGRFTVDLHPVFRPYLGAGPGIYVFDQVLRDETLGRTEEDTRFRGGFQLAAGTEFRITRNAGVHLEGVAHGASGEAFVTGLVGADVLF